MQSSTIFFSGVVVPSPLRVRSVFTAYPATDRGSMATSSGDPKWAQKTITLPPQRRGCHLITPKILKEIGQDLSDFNCGLAHVFLQHTSASLTINENYDPDVQADTETFLNRIVPEENSAPWRHTMEGPDDMPTHIKSSMFGNQLTIPITKGKLNMGTWQEIEKRNYQSYYWFWVLFYRRCISNITINGTTKQAEKHEDFICCRDIILYLVSSVLSLSCVYVNRKYV